MKKTVRGVTFFAILLAGCGPPNTVRRIIPSGIPDAAQPADRELNDLDVDGQPSPSAGPGDHEPTADALDFRPDGDGGGFGPDAQSPAAFDAAPESEHGPRPDDPPLDAATADLSAAADQAVEPPAPPDASLPTPDVAPPPPLSMPPTTACLRPPARADLVADFETSQPVTVIVPGRGGTRWTVLNATTNTVEVGVASIVERCGSQIALRFDGSTFAGDVPFVQAAFVVAGSTGSPFYDARAYRGVRLALRSPSTVTIQIQFSDRDTDPLGGVCTRCQDNFSASLLVTAEWQTFTVLFSELRQQGTGDRFPALDLTRLSTVQIHAPQVDGAFDLWLDDVRFLP